MCISSYVLCHAPSTLVFIGIHLEQVKRFIKCIQKRDTGNQQVTIKVSATIIMKSAGTDTAMQERETKGNNKNVRNARVRLQICKPASIGPLLYERLGCFYNYLLVISIYIHTNMN